VRVRRRVQGLADRREVLARLEGGHDVVGKLGMAQDEVVE
jgi:hypothetical protein